VSPGGAAARAAVAGIAVLAADQLAKAIVRTWIDRGETVDLPLGISLVNVRNDGVAFGILGGNGALVLAITVLAAAGLLYYLATQPRRPGQWIAVGLLAGGAAGNVIDRIAAGEVTDFIDLPAWPAFNLADIAITAGISILVITEVWADWRAHRAGA
jgi:signal peptidase II